MVQGYLILGAVILIEGLAIYLIFRNNKKLRKDKNIAEYQTKKTIHNLDTIIDHTATDDLIVSRQQIIKKQIIEAKDDKDVDKIISNIRHIFNSNKL